MKPGTTGRAAAFLAVFAATAGGAPLSAAARTYVVDAAQSTVRIHVGRSGMLSFAGHKHEVAAPGLTGEVVADPEDLRAARVALTFDATALVVLPEGEPEGDVPKVQEAMFSPKVLDVARFPEVRFVSKAAAGRATSATAWTMDLAGEMTIHGVTRPVTLPVRVELAGDVLTASGETVLRHDDFGMKPVSVAGVVKVKNEIGVTFRIVARAR